MTATILSQSPNLDAEEALLGSLLTQNEALALALSTGLTASHFSQPIYQLIFTEISRKVAEGLVATPLTIKDALPSREFGGRSAGQLLAHLCARAVPIAASISHAEVVVQLATRRSLLASARALEHANDTGLAPDEAIKIFYQQIDSTRLGLLDTDFRNVNADIETTMSYSLDYVDAVAQGISTLTSFKTGIPELDKILGGGFHPGHLVLCAARPGIGKTSFAVSISRQLAQQREFGVGFFSLEMSKRDLGLRFLTEMSYTHKDPIHYDGLLCSNPIISLDHQQRLHDARYASKGLPLEFDYSSFLTVHELTAKTRAMTARLKQTHNLPLGIVFIDYLKFLKAGDRYKGSRVYELGEITAALKKLALNLNICIVLLAQLNRELMKRDSKRPILSDLRDSGDLEADADVVAFLHRDHYYLTQNLTRDEKLVFANKENEMDIDIAKQRMGQTGSIQVFCHMPSSVVRSAPGLVF